MRSANRPTKRALSAAAALIAVLALTSACGSGSSASSSPPADASANTGAHNQQDVTFAAQAAALNEQLATMTNILMAKVDDPTAEASLEDLNRTAGERVVLCRSWLGAWGTPGPTPTSTPGIINDQQFDSLTDSNGPELAKFVNSVVDTQSQGTATVTNVEIAGGENTAAVQFARELQQRSPSELANLAHAVTG